MTIPPAAALQLLFALTPTWVGAVPGPCVGDAPDPSIPSEYLRAARSLSIARSHPDPAVRSALYRRLEEWADERVGADPDDLDARWWRLAAIGLRTEEASGSEMIGLARRAFEEAERILERDPRHPGAHHALGRLHAGVLRLNPIVRFVARRLVGADALSDASWEMAERHLKTAIEVEPCALHHRYELARAYFSQGRKHDALLELRTMLGLPDSRPMDPVARAMGLGLLAELAGGAEPAAGGAKVGSTVRRGVR